MGNGIWKTENLVDFKDVTDNFACVVSGLSISPTQRQTGCIVSVACFELQSTYNQFIQRSDNRTGSKYRCQFLINKRAIQAIAAEQNHISGLQFDGFAEFYLKQIFGAAQAIGYLVAPGMVARLFFIDHAPFQPLLNHRMVECSD